MYFKQFYLGCLAHASYLIGSKGEAAVVDPQRDVEQYIKEAEANGFKIKYVIETHLHADFVSGHRELSDRTGAQIVFGQKAGATFPHLPVKDGDELHVGGIRLRILETPGHTPEGISILVDNPANFDEPMKVLTGDTLFIGDVGRPDLAGAKGYTAEQMAGMLYDSLHNKLLALADTVEVYPAHGAGSLCGRNISSETSSTIGQQRQFNYALKPMAKEEFIKLMTADLPEAPAYFPKDAEINRGGAPALTEVPCPTAMKSEEVNQHVQNGVVILDIRKGGDFGNWHVPGAINIGLDGQFASWAGSLLVSSDPLILVTDEVGQVDEAVMRLARVGIERVIGYLDGGMYAWDKAGLTAVKIRQMPVDELNAQIAEHADLQIIDVRRPAEFGAGHVPGAINASLTEGITDVLTAVDKQRPTAVICGSGYRSSAATGLLARAGFTQLYNIVGGTAAWINAGFAVEQPEQATACNRS